MCWESFAWWHWDVSCKRWGWPSMALTGQTSSLRDHNIAIPHRLPFVNNLRTSFLCCAQACGYECFIVHSNGCGGEICLEIRFLLQKYDKNGSQDCSRRACMQAGAEEPQGRLLKILQSVNSSYPAMDKTRLMWWFPHPFFYVVHPFLMFAFCSKLWKTFFLLLCFLPAYHLQPQSRGKYQGLLAGVKGQGGGLGYSWAQQRKEHRTGVSARLEEYLRTSTYSGSEIVVAAVLKWGWHSAIASAQLDVWNIYSWSVCKYRRPPCSSSKSASNVITRQFLRSY